MIAVQSRICDGIAGIKDPVAVAIECGVGGNITFIIETIGIAINGVAVVVKCHTECGSGTTGTRGVQGWLDSNFKFTVGGEFEELRRWNGECGGAECCSAVGCT